VPAHNAHVTQGLEVYKDGLIAYSSGNFLFDQDAGNVVETSGAYGLKVV
jgi:poly-gamma-glutamate capsule biosynthesis protein CapA/YwtB (metallophosphatase superfamily)